MQPSRFPRLAPGVNAVHTREVVVQVTPLRVQQHQVARAVLRKLPLPVRRRGLDVRGADAADELERLALGRRHGSPGRKLGQPGIREQNAVAVGETDLDLGKRRAPLRAADASPGHLRGRGEPGEVEAHRVAGVVAPRIDEFGERNRLARRGGEIPVIRDARGEDQLRLALLLGEPLERVPGVSLDRSQRLLFEHPAQLVERDGHAAKARVVREQLFVLADRRAIDLLEEPGVLGRREVQPRVVEEDRARRLLAGELHLPEPLAEAVVRDAEIEAAPEVVVRLVAVELPLQEGEAREGRVAPGELRSPRSEEAKIEIGQRDAGIGRQELSPVAPVAPGGELERREGGESRFPGNRQFFGMERKGNRRRGRRRGGAGEEHRGEGEDCEHIHLLRAGKANTTV